MILVADSGSTKTNWELVDNKKNVVCFQTMGLNPFYVTKDIVKNELSLHFPSDINTNYIKDIYFYGAGCSSTERCNIIKFGIGYLFKKANIYVAHDLMGAARALFGQKDGIVAILGTGSNSCLYNGHKIISNIPSLGYVLGDEGSGAILGKKLIQSLLYNELPQYLIDKFFLKYKTNKNNLLETIYKKPYPNRFLASFTYFLSENSNGCKDTARKHCPIFLLAFRRLKNREISDKAFF